MNLYAKLGAKLEPGTKLLCPVSKFEILGRTFVIAYQSRQTSAGLAHDNNLTEHAEEAKLAVAIARECAWSYTSPDNGDFEAIRLVAHTCVRYPSTE